MEDTTQANSRTNKRNRGLLSCTECHRRKQKCNRLTPCNDCTERGVPHKCQYKVPLRGPHQSADANGVGAGKVKNARLKRIITGQEVILTPESVDALGIRVPPSGVLHAISMSDEDLHQVQKNLSQAVPPRPKSPNVVSGLTTHLKMRFVDGLDPFDLLPDTSGEPVRKQLLIHYFVAALAPWLSYLDDGLTELSPRISWLPFALEHKPLFYGTMLTAAVHLHRRRPLSDPSALFWFKAQTIRLANERLNDPSEGATDQMIMVALILLYFNVGPGNAAEFEIHLKGIRQMLKLRGGIDNLGMRGMLKNWLGVCYGPWSEGWEYGQFSKFSY